MNLQFASQPLPPSMDWRWTRILGISGVVFTVASAAAGLSTQDHLIPVSLAAIAAGLFAMAFRGRSVRLHELVMARSKNEDESSRLAILGLASAGLTHELKNTVAVWHGFEELTRKALNDGAPTERVAELLATTERQAARLRTELADFLSLAQPKNGGTRRLNDVITEVLALLSPIALEKGVNIESTIAEGIGRPVLEPSFRRALLNVGLNAVSAAQSRVRIDAKVMEGSAVVSIEDDGPGVEPSAEPLLFTPFASARGSGTGLGLVQVREAMESEQGTVRHERLTPNGARFVLTLPFPKTPADTDPPIPAPV